MKTAGLGIAGFATLFFCLTPIAATAAPQRPKKNMILAQKLAEDAHAKHPEAGEVGIVTVGAKGCTTIASTDKGDIGEKCEKDDSEPIRTGKPYVEKEKKDYDVSLPLHDVSGKLVGSVGIELKPKTGESQEDVVKRAQAIAAEIESAIPSKASLTRPI